MQEKEMETRKMLERMKQDETMRSFEGNITLLQYKYELINNIFDRRFKRFGLG